MEQDIQYRLDLAKKYRAQVEPFFRYIPWFQERVGQKAYTNYEDDSFKETSMRFPVYEGTLLSFVKDMSKTELMDRNYRYVCNRYHLESITDEITAISKAELVDFDMLAALMTKYVMGGMTKSRYWSEAVEHGIFLDLLVKMKEIIEFYDAPTAE